MRAVVPDVELGYRRVPPHPGPVGVDGRLDGGAARPLRTPSARAATTRLVASRRTSHSKGPGRVSSKSRRSKARLRSGVAHSPKLRTWASPQSWTSMPLCGREPRSRGHHRGRAPEVAPGRQGHPPVAQGEQSGIADVLLVEDGPEGIVSAAPGRPQSLAPAGGGPAGLPAGGAPFGDGGAEVVAGSEGTGTGVSAAMPRSYGSHVGAEGPRVTRGGPATPRAGASRGSARCGRRPPVRRRPSRTGPGPGDRRPGRRTRRLR